jgi:hypothetical protein
MAIALRPFLQSGDPARQFPVLVFKGSQTAHGNRMTFIFQHARFLLFWYTALF